MVLSVFTVWSMGLALSVFDYGRAWRRAKGLFNHAGDADPETLRTLRRLKSALRVEDEVVCKVHESSEAFAISLPGTGIVVPARASDFVIAHELAHVKNRDLAWSGVGSLAQALFWFLPWVHALNRELRLWQDVAADGVALSSTSTPRSQAIGEILAAVSSGVTAPALGLGPEAETCTRRFKELFEGRHRLALTVAAALLGLVLLCPVTVWSVPTANRANGAGARLKTPQLASRGSSGELYTIASP